MTRAEEITQLRTEVRRLRAALAALIGVDDHLSGYDAGWADGAAGRPVGGIDPEVLAMGQRVTARLNGTEPGRHLRPVPTT